MQYVSILVCTICCWLWFILCGLPRKFVIVVKIYVYVCVRVCSKVWLKSIGNVNKMCANDVMFAFFMALGVEFKMKRVWCRKMIDRSWDLNVRGFYLDFILAQNLLLMWKAVDGLCYGLKDLRFALSNFHTNPCQNPSSLIVKFYLSHFFSK